jgi:hypothetical protein
MLAMMPAKPNMAINTCIACSFAWGLGGMIRWHLVLIK